jgi:AcrR family transcriptional regulator
MRKPLSREERARARQAQILAAARDLFRRQGYGATTTKELAQQLGVAESLIFHYFPRKADLLITLARQPGMFPGELERLQSALPAATAADVLDALTALWRGLLLDDRELFGMLLAEAQSSQEVAQILHHQVNALTSELAAYLDAGRARGSVLAHTPSSAAAEAVVGSAMTLLAIHRFDTPERFAAVLDERLDHTLALWRTWLPEAHA